MENKQSNMQVVSLDRDDDGIDEALPPGISVAKFDYSIENHLKAMNKILKLSREPKFTYDESEIQRMSSSVSFLREWRDFCYQPQDIRFACESETPRRRDVTGGLINLTQFSSAAVPKDISDGNKVSSHLSKDFVMYVGGLVWAMDWCPRVQRPDCDINLELIAVAAHPPDSSYHKIGAPLTGRGVIQIWGLLNPGVKDHDVISQVKEKSKKNSKLKATNKPRGRPRKNPINESGNNQHLHTQAVQLPGDSTKFLLTDGISHDAQELVAIEDPNTKVSAPKKPRGRPRMKPLKESNSSQAGISIEVQKQVPSDSSAMNQESSDQQEPRKKPRRKPLKEPTDNLNDTTPAGVSTEQQQIYSGGAGATYYNSKRPERAEGGPTSRRLKESSSKLDSNSKYLKPLAVAFPEDKVNDNNQYLRPLAIKLPEDSSKLLEVDKMTNETPEIVSKEDDGQDPMRSSEDKANHVPHETDPDGCYISEDVALPRLVMCLAHNGKVAWDVKWRPSDTSVSSKHRMGHLAVLLGNGALEVWDVPLPQAAEAMFSACRKEGTDPRFMKLEPVFRCSMLKCGDRQSIPLTVEWSTSSPHDLILAGCHDGAVALWKFSADGPLKDTRPLLCFSADTVPIRALAWAPVESGSESANVIVTAGHKGVKFWDIRDPFRPLWDVPAQRIVYGLDWLSDPRCLLLSFDDGEIRIISMSKAASDVPVTGKPFAGTQQQGLHSYHCSSSSIWGVQVSRLTGVAAYCCSDGTVLHFQLTTKAVEKDPRRNREPHYLCGALRVEESGLTVFSPLPDVPFPMKKSSKEWDDAPRSRRGLLTNSNQEKRAMLKTPKYQPLALCYGSDSGSEDTLASKTEGSSKKKPKRDDEIPAKIVAIHGVRWNMNKGSERWLCYGGAAGVLRCQEITSP